jgi:hypothetical protein
MSSVFLAKLVVTPDNTTKGSEGRLYLQLPDLMVDFIGRKYRTCGQFSRDGAILLVSSGDGLTISPRRQIWWKNGVREHGIRENWEADVHVLKTELLVVELTRRTGEPAPFLPPHQEYLF